MKIFCSYAYTGENASEVTARMKTVVEALKQAGHDAYCPVDDPRKIELQQKQDIKAIFDFAFKRLLERDALAVIIASERKSEGQLMEIGVALAAGKPVYLFLHQSARVVPSHLPKLAAQTFVWSDEQELAKALSQVPVRTKKVRQP